MKALLLLLPGLCEPARAESGGRTALAAARASTLEAWARSGRVGRVNLAPAGRLPEDSSALLSLLGYDPRRERVGRGTLEAAGLGVALQPGDQALRLDLLTTWRGMLVDPWAGFIGPAEARLLVTSLAAELDGDGLEIHAGRGPRNLVVLRGLGAEAPIAVPPGRVPDGQPERSLPSGAGAERLRQLMVAAGPVLAGHDVNRVRVDLGEKPADAIWPWGPGSAAALEPFRLRTGRSLAVLARGAAPRGLGKLVGARALPAPPPAEGSPALVRDVLAALETHDVVLLHVEGPGEATPADLAELDRQVLAPLARGLQRRGDTRLLLSTDRPSPHLPPSTAVPFLLWGPGVEGGRRTEFHEAAAAASDLAVPQGHHLLDHLLGTGRSASARAEHAE